ncbi:uncharacterized protein si:dkey-3d4.3 isoform X2 [Brienomyrus brachyistius]|nr:uncharacterized protein si:dkey-3d4.3 isoform X2 [Brienomyrus brachyistius]
MIRKTGPCLWTPVSQEDPAPCDRYKHACCCQGGNIYLLGGRSQTTLNDFWKYNVVRNEWTSLDCGCEEALEQASMVANQRLLYVFGGMIDCAYAQRKTPLWLYNTDTDQWQHCQGKEHQSQRRAPVNRKGHSAVVFEAAMYVFGGYVDLKGSSGEFWSFHFDSGVWSSLTRAQGETGPGPRHGHSAVVHQDGMYLYGGLAGLRELGDFWRWSFSRSNWSSIRSHSGPSRLVGHSAVVCRGSMLLFGGAGGQCLASEDLWRFSFADQTWERLSRLTEVAPPYKVYHCSVGLGPAFQTQSAAFPACLDRSKSSRAKFKALRYFPGALGRPTGPIEDTIHLETFCVSSVLEKDYQSSRLAEGSPQTMEVTANGLGLTFENRDACSRDMDCEETPSPGVSEHRHPDVLLLLGGRPLSEGASISVWQMTPSDL